MTDKMQYVIFILMCVILLFCIRIVAIQKNTEKETIELQRKISVLYEKFDGIEIKEMREE